MLRVAATTALRRSAPHASSNAATTALRRAAPHARALCTLKEKGKGEEASFFRKQQEEQLRNLKTGAPVRRVGVVGLGLMGHGIAQTAAEKGLEVVAVDLEERFIDSGMRRIEDSVRKMASKAVAKGKLSEADAEAQAAATLGRITPSLDRAALGSCDAVIEAVIEDLSLKESLYREIGQIVSDDCIIASNTSSLPITKMGEFCGRPAQAHRVASRCSAQPFARAGMTCHGMVMPCDDT
jgi:hypothetical protein